MRIRTGGAGVELKGRAAEMAKLDTSVSLVGKVLEHEVKHDEFSDVRRIPIAAMRPDPEQPRELRISLDMLRNPDGIPDARTRARVESIIGLAATITEIGQQTSVEVYRDGSLYNIVSGERRYWAGRLANLESLNAKVLPERPARLRLKQYIENAQRDELDTRETLKALESIIAEGGQVGEPIVSWATLKRVTGMSNATASRWWAVLSGPADVRNAITDERISSLTAAEAIARTEDAVERAELIEKLSQAERDGRATEVLRGSTPRRLTEAPTPAKATVGRPKKVIFGGTPNLGLARVVLRKLAGEEPKGIDWNDPEALSAAFKAVIQELEEEFRLPDGSPAAKIRK